MTFRGRDLSRGGSGGFVGGYGSGGNEGVERLPAGVVVPGGVFGQTS